MITKFAPKRTVTTSTGKTYVKRPKVQRLITPDRIRRKRTIKKIKEERRKYTDEQRKAYQDTLKRMRRASRTKKPQVSAQKK
jgi:small subunit ribosomal protein S6e